MADRRFEGRVVWITGASSGIGEACARAFAKEGARLVLSARRKDALDSVAARCAELGAKGVLVRTLDQEDTSSLEGHARAVLDAEGRVDVMLHNAGISQRSRAIETSVAVDEKLLRVNYLGPVALTRALLPSMIARGRGRFVVVSSVTGIIGAPLRSSYAASKHALHGFFDTLRAEHHADGVRVTMVCPGYVKTEVSRNALTGDGSPRGTMDATTARGISTEKCAASMLDAVHSGDEELYVGGAKELLAVYLKRYVPTVFSQVLRRVKNP